MADITEFPLNALECGKCYTLSGTLIGISHDSGGIFYIGNDTSKQLINGFVLDGMTFSIDFTLSSNLITTLYLESEGLLNIENMQILLNPECAEKYCSECFGLEAEQCCSGEYLHLQWTNNDDGYGFNYTTMPLIHSLTLKGGLRNADYPYDEDYFNTSSGRFFPVYVEAVKTQEMWVERIPEYIHDALRLGVVHDEFTINGQSYSKAEGGYSPDWDTPNSLLAPVIVKVRKRTQNTKNVNC